MNDRAGIKKTWLWAGTHGNRSRSLHETLAFLLLAGSVLLLDGAPAAQASDFLYGNLTWSADGPSTQVAFRFTAAFLRSDYAGTAADGHPRVGDVISDSLDPTTLDFGDGSATGALRFLVTWINTNDNTVTGMALDPARSTTSIRHRYRTIIPGGYYRTLYRTSFIAAVRGNARLPNLNNRSGADFRLGTLVILGTHNSAPVSTFVPVMDVPLSAAATFSVLGADPNADRLHWRLSTDAEAGGGSSPPNLSVNANTGVVTWNNLGLDFAKLWTAQIILEDLDVHGNVRSYNPVDFLLRINPGTNQALVCAANPPGPFTVKVGGAVSATVTATGVNSNQAITLNSGLLPNGATLNPPLPLTGPSGVSTALDWVPAATQTGPYMFLFSALNANSQATQCFVNVNVFETLHVLGAEADCAHGTVTIQFSGAVELGGNFSFSPSLTILTTNYGAGQDEIMLVTGGLAPGRNYSLTISGVRDLTVLTNTLAPDPTIAVVNCSDSCGPLDVSAGPGGSVQLEWGGAGAVLQFSADLATWVDLTNAYSPYLVPSDTLSEGFFRLRCANNGPAPSIVGPESWLSGVGATVIFQAQVTGQEPLSYRWIFNGTNLPGATTATLILPNVNGPQVGAYQLLVTNLYGTALSQIGWLILTNNTDGLKLTTIYSAPPVSLLLIGPDNSGGLPLSTTAAQPPVSLQLLGENNTGGLELNATVAQPPVEVQWVPP